MGTVKKVGKFGERWMIDGKVNLTDACRNADWNELPAVKALVGQGIYRYDAEGFVRFLFAVALGEDHPTYHLSSGLWQRLSCE